MTVPECLTFPPPALCSHTLCSLLTSWESAAFSFLGWDTCLSVEFANPSQTMSPGGRVTPQGMDGRGGLSPGWSSPWLSTAWGRWSQDTALACGECLGPSSSACDSNESQSSLRSQNPLSWGLPPGTWGWLPCSGRHRELRLCSEGTETSAGFSLVVH